MPQEKKEGDSEEDEKYFPYMKQELHLHVLCDTSVYKDRTQLIPMIQHLYKIDSTLGMYDPVIYLSDFWVLIRDLILLDDEGLERIKKVQAGEKQEADDELTEK